MAKIVQASCAAGIVTIQGIPLDEAEILSEGVGDSEGIAIIDEDKVYYVASSALDLKDGITKLSSMLTDIQTIITSIGAAMTGPTTAPPPTLATGLASLATKITAYQATAEALI